MNQTEREQMINSMLSYFTTYIRMLQKNTSNGCKTFNITEFKLFRENINKLSDDNLLILYSRFQLDLSNQYDHIDNMPFCMVASLSTYFEDLIDPDQWRDDEEYETAFCVTTCPYGLIYGFCGDDTSDVFKLTQGKFMKDKFTFDDLNIAEYFPEL